MSTSANNTQINIQTYQFRLRANLIDENLILEVEDLIDWKIYSREYTEDDSGKDIHKKVTPMELFHTLKQCKKQRIQDSVQVKIGEIVYVGETPCFKIDHSGMITIFVSIRNLATQQLISYKSVLFLQQKGNIPQNKRQKQQIILKIKKIQSQFKQNIKTLTLQNIQLKQQNKNLKSQIEAIKINYSKIEIQNQQQFNKRQILLEQKLILTNKQFLQQFQQLKININQQQSNLNKSKKQLQLQNVQLKRKLLEQANKIQKIEKDFSQWKAGFVFQKDIIEKLRSESMNHKKRMDQLEKKLKTQGQADQINQLKKQSSQLKSFLLIASLEQPFSKKFNISFLGFNCRIQYIGENCTTQYIFNKIIPHNTVYSFKIKIIKTSDYRQIMIGVVDQTRQRTFRSSWNSKNAVCYHGYKGVKFPGGKSQGCGFDEGETVQTMVDLINKQISWSVAGIIRATHNLQILNDKSRIFRPYIELSYDKDIIELLYLD